MVDRHVDIVLVGSAAIAKKGRVAVSQVSFLATCRNDIYLR